MCKGIKICLCLSACVAAVAPLVIPAIALGGPEGLLAEDQGIRQRAQENILARRTNDIFELVEIIKDPKNEQKIDVVKRAIFCLGELRAVEATNALIDRLIYPYDKPILDEWTIGHNARAETRSVEEWYPAAAALIKIGRPCLPSVLAKVSQTDDGTEIAVCSHILNTLCKKEELVLLVQKAAAAEVDLKRKERLQRFAGRLML